MHLKNQLVRFSEVRCFHHQFLTDNFRLVVVSWKRGSSHVQRQRSLPPPSARLQLSRSAYAPLAPLSVTAVCRVSHEPPRRASRCCFVGRVQTPQWLRPPASNLPITPLDVCEAVPAGLVAVTGWRAGDAGAPTPSPTTPSPLGAAELSGPPGGRGQARDDSLLAVAAEDGRPHAPAGFLISLTGDVHHCSPRPCAPRYSPSQPQHRVIGLANPGGSEGQEVDG